MEVVNKKNQTPFDLLEGNWQERYMFETTMKYMASCYGHDNPCEYNSDIFKQILKE